MKRSVSRIVLAIILVVILSAAAVAQTFMLKSIPGETPQFGLRYLRPNFKNDSDLSTFSGIYDIRVNLPINERWSIDASLPYTRFAFGEDDDSESYIGNIYAGLQSISRKGGGSAIVSFGAFFPTAEEDLGHLLFGVLTNYENMFKYYPDSWTLTGNFAWFKTSEGGARLGLEAGPDLLVPVGDNDSDTDFLLHYGFTAGYQGKRFLAAAELIGLVVFTGDSDEFSDRFVHSIDFGASYLSRHFAPGIFYKIYLKDEFRDMVDGVLGVSLDVIM
jgi:hypothetical protein